MNDVGLIVCCDIVQPTLLNQIQHETLTEPFFSRIHLHLCNNVYLFAHYYTNEYLLVLQLGVIIVFWQHIVPLKLDDMAALIASRWL